MQHAQAKLKAILFVCAALVFVASTNAEIPKMISYQGKITDTAGATIADGDYDVEFHIYELESGGTSIWESGSIVVAVEDGVFSVMLGQDPQPSINLEFDRGYWLQVTIEGDIQAPRKRLTSAGYAYMASGLVPGTSVIGTISAGSMSAIKGVNEATSGSTFGMHGRSSSTAGSGVYGSATASTGYAYGVKGQSGSSYGSGVYGIATASTGSTSGVRGETNSPTGYGVYGVDATSSGVACGVRGESINGYGVCGVAYSSENPAYGVFGQSSSSAGKGVYGWAMAVTGETYGVHGRSQSSNGRGVFGRAVAATGVTFGVLGESWSSSGVGVRGKATSTTGTCYGGKFTVDSISGRAIEGVATAATGVTYGVRGISQSTSGIGVYGRADGPGGMFESDEGNGVLAYANDATGEKQALVALSYSPDGGAILGLPQSTTGVVYGVEGRTISTNGIGVSGVVTNSSGANIGVHGETWSTDGYGVYYSGNFGGSGLMRSIVKTSQGPTGLAIHATAGDWVEDFGEGRLVRGKAYVELDPLYLETVIVDEENPMKVFIQLREDCNGVFVQTGNTGFNVVELNGGSGNARFSYRVVARKMGSEDKRLELCRIGFSDPYLYPELREKRLERYEKERLRFDNQHRRTIQRGPMEAELGAAGRDGGAR